MTTETLNNGLKALGLTISDSKQYVLVTFIKILARWNRVYNLTGIHNLEEMVSYHLLDSLSVQPYIKGSYILDIGTGAGLPGIPLAIANPQKQFVLLDSAGKKIRFIRQVTHELGLQNITPVHCRAEQYSNDVYFDTIVTRAVGSIDEVVNLTSHMAHSSTRWVFMKGAVDTAKVDSVWRIHKLSIPGINSPRFIVYNDDENNRAS